jgi:hypothetical protein
VSIARRFVPKAEPDLWREKHGAGERTRTSDLLITNQLLYHLSYTGIGGGV